MGRFTHASVYISDPKSKGICDDSTTLLRTIQTLVYVNKIH